MSQKAFPFIIILLVIVSFLAGVFYMKSRSNDNRVLPAATTPTPTESSPLSIENLKLYASQSSLDTQKFNQCLDNSEKANRVKEDIAQGTSLGVSGTPAFFINGRFLGGAFPFELFKEIIDKEIAGKGSSNPKDYSTALQNAAKPQGNQPPSFNPKPIRVEIKADDPVKGPSEAKVTIVEFSDFECPFCSRAYLTVNQILATYSADVKIVFKQYPLQFHQYAQKAAEASLCAKDQGKFWEYHDKLFDSQN